MTALDPKALEAAGKHLASHRQNYEAAIAILIDERDEARAQVAALREALEGMVNAAENFRIPRTDKARTVLTDTAKAAAQYQRVGDLAKMLIEISEQPIPDVMAGAITCGGASTQMDAAQIGWAACFQEFERRIKAMIAAPKPDPEDE